MMIPPSAIAHKEAGNQHFASGENSLALQSYRAALSDLPKDDKDGCCCYPEQERFSLACHSNAALCLLRLSQPRDAVEECRLAESLPIFQVAADEKIRKKVLARHAEAMIDWRNQERSAIQTETTDAAAVGSAQIPIPEEQEVWVVLEEARGRGYLEKRGASSLGVRENLLWLGGRLSASSDASIASDSGSGGNDDDDDGEVRRAFEAWLCHLVKIGKITKRQAKMSRKRAPKSLQHALEALNAVLPKPSVSIHDICSYIIHWIREGTPNAVNMLRNNISNGNIHPSSVDRNGGHLLGAASFGLLQCKNGGGSRVSTYTFLSILDLLVDDLGVNIDQRSPQKRHCRTPLMWVAKANNHRAVRAMLEKGARVNLRDEEGWTALGSALMRDEDDVTEEAARDRIETVRILLDAGADTESVSATGFTPLMVCCLRPDVESIELLVSHGARRDFRSPLGVTPITLLEQYCEKTPKLLEDCRRALLLDCDDRTMTEDIKALRFQILMNRVLIPAHNENVRERPMGNSEEAKAQGYNDRAKQELGVLGALMTHVGMDANLLQKRITSEEGNWLETLYNKIEAMVPNSFLKTYRDVEPNEQELGMYMTFVEGRKSGSRRFNRQADLKASLFMYRERGHMFHMKKFERHILDPIQHAVGYAVPIDSILERIESYGPLVEVGAGTGYWSGVLRARGVDTIAYDANPPLEGTMNNEFFSFLYTDVQKGDGTVIFEGQAGSDLARERTLLIVWPNLNDSEDNPHLFPPVPHPPIWDADCLLSYIRAGGKTVIYVGEREENISVIHGARSESGVSSSRRFQNILKEYFLLEEQIDCPRWFRFEDDVTIWKRK